ncbi:MAG: MBL fold metallo-hydrolase [Bryobacteraceae bacterium]|jgi:beta-lactamase superfamily II metal-dependent hydrolase
MKPLVTRRSASALLLCLTFPFACLAAASGDLTAYLIDVEGGQSTLFITPAGQSVLIDTGFPGFNGRDADRIAAVAKTAGVKQIDYLIVTHYHADHVGGVPAIAERLPIRNFVNHGDTVEHTPAGEKLYGDYQKEVAKGNQIVVKPGDKLPIQGLDWSIVSAAGKVIDKPLPGAGKPNMFCDAYKPKDADPTENAQSVGSVIGFGKFRVVDLGDLTWNKEHDLMCPNNKIGQTDVYIVSHHGQDISGSPVLVHALHPKVAIMNNGEKKGGMVEAWDTIHTSPGLLDIWQLHFSAVGGKEHNTGEKMIANMTTDQDKGSYLKLTAQANGHFEVTNPATGYSKKY